MLEAGIIIITIFAVAVVAIMLIKMSEQRLGNTIIQLVAGKDGGGGKRDTALIVTTILAIAGILIGVQLYVGGRIEDSIRDLTNAITQLK